VYEIGCGTSSEHAQQDPEDEMKSFSKCEDQCQRHLKDKEEINLSSLELAIEANDGLMSQSYIQEDWSLSTDNSFPSPSLMNSVGEFSSHLSAPDLLDPSPFTMADYEPDDTDWVGQAIRNEDTVPQRVAADVDYADVDVLSTHFNQQYLLKPSQRPAARKLSWLL
jgi:hypothetical protein